MCEHCGCGQEGQHVIVDLATGEHVHADGTRHSHGPAHHHHAHDREHHHPHHAPQTTTIDLEQRLLAKNEALAGENRAWFQARGILALNLVSGPGAGKTTLLERTIAELRGRLRLFVIEGDQATSLDGERIRKAGAPAVQVNTGAGCHLDADMVRRGLDALAPVRGSVVMIENVGNLVCPALFDLGERAKVALLSVTEGEDKPLKYPHMFRAADLVLINKIDLVPHLDVDVARMAAHVREVNPAAAVLNVSARSGAGLAEWYGWLSARAEEAATRPGSAGR